MDVLERILIQHQDIGQLAGRSASSTASSTMMRWRDWKRLHPNTLVLSKVANGRTRGTTDNYEGYHASPAIGVTGRLGFKRDDLNAKARIVGFRFANKAYAIDLATLRRGGILISTIEGERFMAASTPDASGARVFRARENVFTVRTERGATMLIDQATQSRWSPLEGKAASGPLAGTQLDEVPVTLSYWFAWCPFFPDVVVLKR